MQMRAVVFFYVPSCPLWLVKFKCLDHKGRKGTQRGTHLKLKLN